MELFRLFGSIVINDDEARRNLQSVDSEAQASSNRMMESFKRLGGVIAGVFAIDKLKDLGVSAVEAAANAQAMSAQFSQVFGDISKDAQGTIDGLGKDFGMVPNRIKPAMTQMTSMFKGLGLDTKTAMGTAKNAVTLVADAAAFYDKSFEDANAALNSFIKGNYEGGESIGLFANETQMAAWASKNLHLDWKKLNEAGKQTARLKFAQAMQEAAGATGQAKRESNSYQNQLGNLKQTWEDLKGKLATPILNPVINGLKSMASWLGKVDTGKVIEGVKSVGSYLTDTFKPTVDDVKNGLQLLWDKFKENGGVDAAKSAFEGFKDALAWIRDNGQVVTAVIGGLAAGFATFKILTTINAAIGIFNTLMVAFRTGTVMATLAQWGLNTALLANPFTWIAVAVGLLIAAVILLWKNWDSVSKWLGKSWDWIKEKAVAVWDWLVGFFKKWGLTILQVITGPIGALVIYLAKNWDNIKEKAVKAWTMVKDKIVQVWEGIKSGISSAIDKIKGFFTGMWDKANEIAGKIKGAFGKIFDKIKVPHFKLKGSLDPTTWLKNGLPKLSVDWYANGTNFAPGGLAVVGERGPELINLPRGSKVNTASQTESMLSKNERQPAIIQVITPDKRTLAEWLVDDITEYQEFNLDRDNRFRR